MAMTVDRDAALAKYAEIEKLDEVIDSASGSKDAGKRALANQIASETETNHKKMVDQLITALNKIEDKRVLVGAVTSLRSAVQSNFNKQVDEFLTAEVESNTTEGPKVSPEELQKALDERKEAVKHYNILTSVLEMMGEDTEDLPKPKKMTGPRGPQGKRGPRLPKNLQWAVDGKDRSGTTNNLSSIAATVCPDGWKVADLRNFLTEQGFDFENIPTEFSFTLPNDKVLSGRLTDDVVDDDEDEETEDEASEVEE
jgi:hypothetical protein